MRSSLLIRTSSAATSHAVTPVRYLLREIDGGLLLKIYIYFDVVGDETDSRQQAEGTMISMMEFCCDGIRMCCRYSKMEGRSRMVLRAYRGCASRVLQPLLIMTKR